MEYKILLLCFVLGCMAGCCPNRVAVASHTADSLVVRREVRYVEKLRDTVIYVQVPVETRRVEAKTDTSFLETSFACSAARVNGDGTLFHSLENKPQEKTVPVTVMDSYEKETELAADFRVETVEVPVRIPLTWLQKTLMGCGVTGLCIAVVLVVVRMLARRV